MAKNSRRGKNLPRGRSAEPKARLYRRWFGGDASAASRAAWRRRDPVACEALGVPAWYSARASGARKRRRGSARKETNLAGCLYLRGGKCGGCCDSSWRGYRASWEIGRASCRESV